MNKYLSLDGLSYLIVKLLNKFSVIGHTHTKSEITDLIDSSNLIVSDDGEGNVTLVCSASSITTDNTGTITNLEERVTALENDKVSLPTNADGSIDYGTTGQVAISDESGGIEWSDVTNANEVSY